MKDDEWKRRRQVGALVTLPFVMIIPMIIGMIIGKAIDHFFDTSPYIMYALLALGFASGMRECYRIIKQFGGL
ncbi:putative membrane protein [Waddlia chondrophila 2032/99]|uniref:Putative membrane protein n=2 Tax=Waddlia chondrophila TaxID=71667 RepID=D6YWG7_WADCW|nr:AtpZ/AtpI family protein [Waddlia chondrophila]ADI38478.1 putative membrane protein [Waddlia chondrophila WSU 86-1044]CCB91560.1 putative membrane protein [Waddlia chondrophila 2032/99]